MNLMDQLKEHKRILLPGVGILIVAVGMTLLSANGLGTVNTGSVDSILSDPKQYSSPPAMQLEEDANYSAIIETNYGDITVELYEGETPVTVNNFIFLANEDFYDGLIFHRVVKDFVIQGGDPLGDGTGGPGYQFEDEIVSTLEFEPFVLAMANSGPGTNGSQFFITTRNSSTIHLTGAHTIFGKVTAGFEAVDEIEDVRVDSASKPVVDVVIRDIKIITE